MRHQRANGGQHHELEVGDRIENLVGVTGPVSARSVAGPVTVSRRGGDSGDVRRLGEVIAGWARRVGGRLNLGTGFIS